MLLLPESSLAHHSLLDCENDKNYVCTEYNGPASSALIFFHDNINTAEAGTHPTDSGAC